MADFEKAIGNTFHAEGGFQNKANDNANYVHGVLIGTNRGISALAYYEFYKRVPSVSDMMKLSVDEAKKIFKGNYWDKIKGDLIKNQSVAEMMFQYIIGSGQSQVSDLKDIANASHGVDEILVENDLPFTEKECFFINGLDQERYFNALYAWRYHLYDTIVKRNPAKLEFLEGWRNRLATHKYVKNNII